ncbi:MAG: hypothetical protein JWR48_7076 [Mycobacterium sp.]|jgi:hypothetical protein|nr:hypothetical protein [Mycobacterium sp.]
MAGVTEHGRYRRVCLRVGQISTERNVRLAAACGWLSVRRRLPVRCCALTDCLASPRDGLRRLVMLTDDCRYAQICSFGCALAQLGDRPVEADELLGGGITARLQALDFAEPAV